MLSATHILHKTFHIRQGASVGTGFIIELDSQEYLITAKHIVQDHTEGVRIYHRKMWRALPVTGIYHHPEGADVAVITTNRQIAPRSLTENNSSNIGLGESVMMIGFPSDIDCPGSDSNGGYPIPFVKAATVSGFITQGGIDTWYFDGQNHAGFSGSPIIAKQVPSVESKMDAKIIGVEVGYKIDFTRHPNEIPLLDSQVVDYPIANDHVHITDTGFIIGIDIKYAIEIIQTQPHGFLLGR